MTRSRDLLRLAGLPEGNPEPVTSTRTFPDGAPYRVEIPSVEGPAAFEALLEEADRRGVPVHRVSQGSGVMLLTDDEIRVMAALGAERAIEVCLFVGPRAPWEGTAAALVADGGQIGWRHTDLDQLRYALDDVVRAVDLGIRSVLVADEGLIHVLGRARAAGALPADLVVKGSVALGIGNPAGLRLLAEQGLDTVNVPSDAPIGRLAAARSVLEIPIDLYVESPESLGGFARYPEIGEIVRVAAPVHLKFGLKNCPPMYPSGGHVQGLAVGSARERVRRAAIGLEHAARAGLPGPRPPAPRPGVPVLP